MQRRARAYKNNGNSDLAIADYTAAIRLQPKNAARYVARARAWDAKGDGSRAIADYSEAIRLDPQSVYARHDRAIVYAERGDLQTSDLDEAVRVAPKDPRPRELRGCIRVKCGDYESGLADLRAAVVLNPTDPAGKFEAWPKRRLTAEAIRFGEEQVQKMLRDRPAMAQYGGKSDVVCRWAAQVRRRRCWYDDSLGFLRSHRT